MAKCDFCEIRGWGGKAYCLKKEDYVDNSTYDSYCNSYRFDDCPIYRNRSNGGCYLTTACVEYKGLADNCLELNTLRRFRDEYLMNVEGGREQILEYYETAPCIIKAIEKSQRKAEVYEVLYEDVILQCVGLINNGKNEQAREKYTKMVQDLKEEYC